MFTISFVNLDLALRLVKLMTLKEHMLGESPHFTNHAGHETQIMWRKVMPKELQARSPTSPNFQNSSCCFHQFCGPVQRCAIEEN